MPSATVSETLVPEELIERRIYLIRGRKVMLDADLATLYQVATKALNQAVRRNGERFPEDFMFQLTPKEAEALRSQSVTSNIGRGGRRYLPYVFTEHGVGMLSSVLSSPRAVQMNIQIIRAFIRMREVLATQSELAARMGQIETTLEQHALVITSLADEIEDIKRFPEPVHRPIGFTTA
jgi:phage regulator Rha-like protein